jgi:hypothetical protein
MAFFLHVAAGDNPMFIGHFGIALAAKKAAPRTSLGTLIFVAQFLDLLWPILLLADVEHVRISPGITRVSPFDFYDYPVSHSLLMAVGWSVVVAAIYYAVRRYTRGAFVISLAVLSHWILDFIVHRRDLPLWPSGPRVGLGLWNSWPASIVAEVLIFAAGVWIYTTSTPARDVIGRYAFWALVAFLFVGYLSVLAAGAPPNVTALARGALMMWLLVLWGWWADKHRDPAA